MRVQARGINHLELTIDYSWIATVVDRWRTTGQPQPDRTAGDGESNQRSQGEPKYR